jgi:hypothetical protein
VTKAAFELGVRTWTAKVEEESNALAMAVTRAAIEDAINKRTAPGGGYLTVREHISMNGWYYTVHGHESEEEARQAAYASWNVLLLLRRQADGSYEELDEDTYSFTFASSITLGYVHERIRVWVDEQTEQPGGLEAWIEQPGLVHDVAGEAAAEAVIAGHSEHEAMLAGKVAREAMEAGATWAEAMKAAAASALSAGLEEWDVDAAGEVQTRCMYRSPIEGPLDQAIVAGAEAAAAAAAEWDVDAAEAVQTRCMYRSPINGAEPPDQAMAAGAEAAASAAAAPAAAAANEAPDISDSDVPKPLASGRGAQLRTGAKEAAAKKKQLETIRDEAFADDIAITEDMMAWTEEEARTFFESGGTAPSGCA